MWLDFVNSYCCAACLDLCAGPGELAKACLLAKKSYVGVCLTALHCDLLKHHLIEWMMQSMATEGTPFYKSEWADAKKQRDGGKASQSTSTTGTGEGKPKADPKAKATGKKSKKEVESSGRHRRRLTATAKWLIQIGRSACGELHVSNNAKVQTGPFILLVPVFHGIAGAPTCS